MDSAKTKSNIFLIIVLFLLLFVPGFLQALNVLGQSKQLIIGSLVNTGLFLCASFINDKKKIFAFSVLPSISSICSGLLFAGLTKWSIIMMPFIWIGNLLLIYLIKILDKKTNYFVSRICSIIVKVLLIYLGFLLVSHLFNYPAPVVNVMSKSMGVIQLYTATCGCIISSIVILIKNKRFK